MKPHLVTIYALNITTGFCLEIVGLSVGLVGCVGLELFCGCLQSCGQSHQWIRDDDYGNGN